MKLWHMLLVVLAIFFFIAVIRCSKKICTDLFLRKQYTFHFDPIFSDVMCQQVRTAFFGRLAQYGLAGSGIVVTDFPSIDTISIDQVRPNVHHVFITAARPVVMVNHDFVLVANGELADKQDFVSDSLESLVGVVALSDSPALCGSYIAQLSADILAAYDISWCDPTECWLQDKENSHFSIVTNNMTILDQQSLKICARLKASLSERGSFAQNRCWAADIRFDKKIILYAMNERGRYER